MGLCPQSLVGQTHGITSLAKRWWPGCSAPALPHSKERLYLINQSEGSQRSSLKGRPQLEAQAPSASCCVRGGSRQPSFPRAGCLASPTPPNPLQHMPSFFLRLWTLEQEQDAVRYLHTAVWSWVPSGGFLPAGCSLSSSFSPLFFLSSCPPLLGRLCLAGAGWLQEL